MQTAEHLHRYDDQDLTDYTTLDQQERLEQYRHEYSEQSSHALAEADRAEDALGAANAIFDYHKPTELLPDAETLEDTASSLKSAHNYRMEQAENLLGLYKRKLNREDVSDDAYAAVKQDIFGSFGFSEKQTADIVRAWGAFMRSRPKEIGSEKDQKWMDEYMQTMRINFDTMSLLESYEPGTCNALYDRFGIRNFGRYYRTELLEQLNETRREPVEVMISAAEDWNGYNTSNGRMVSRAAHDMGMNNAIFVEAATPIEAFRHLLFVKQRFGQISNVGVSAHGNPNAIELTRNNKLDIDGISKSNAITRLIENGTLAEDADIILAACYAQKLAQEASKQTQGRVVAPGAKTTGLFIKYGSKEVFKNDVGGRFLYNRNVQIYEQGERTNGLARVRTIGRRVLKKVGFQLAA